MFGLGIGELAIIGAGVFFIFGAKKLPELGQGLAKGIRNFQSELQPESKEEKSKS